MKVLSSYYSCVYFWSRGGSQVLVSEPRPLEMNRNQETGNVSQPGRTRHEHMLSAMVPPETIWKLSLIATPTGLLSNACYSLLQLRQHRTSSPRGFSICSVFLRIYYLLCVCMSGGGEWSGQVRVFTHVCHCAHVELRGQLTGVFLTQREKKFSLCTTWASRIKLRSSALAESLYPLSHLDGQGFFFFF